MRIYSILFLLGTTSIQFFADIPNIWILFCLVLLTAGTLTIALVTQKFKRYLAHDQQNTDFSLSIILKSLGVLVAGFVLAAFAAQRHINQQLPEQYEGEELLLRGKIQDIPNPFADGVRFIFKVEQAELIDSSKTRITSNQQSRQSPEQQYQEHPTTKLAFTGKVRLSWYSKQQNVLAKVNAGEVWQFKVRLKRPSGFRNPGGFDYEKWLFTERINATGYVRKSQTLNRRMAQSSGFSIDRIRQNIHEYIQQRVENKSSAAVLSALTVAVRHKLDDRQWELLQQSGTSHLIAISGLHIALLASFAFLPIMLIWRLFPKLNQRVPVRVAGSVVGVLFALIYALLAGFTLPTQRALLMVMIGVWGISSRKNYDATTVLSVALVLVLLLDPLAPMTISFWLSFLAVAIILFFIKRQNQKPRWMMVKLQLLISLAMLPLTLLFFGTASLTSPVANLLAIPWVSLIVVPLSLLALIALPLSITLSDILFQLASLSIDYLFKGLALIDGTVLSDFYPAEIPMSFLVMAFTGLLFLFLPKGFPARWLGVILILPAALFSPDKLKTGEFNYTLLDAGQGMASVLQTSSHTLIYDTGTKVNENFDVGKLVVVPFLRAKGIEKADIMLISHEDIDHRGGAKYVYDQIDIDRVMSSDVDVLAGVNVDACHSGQKWQWDGVDFEILSPPPVYPQNDNNRSCVLKVSNPYHSLLLTADIQKPAEKKLIDTNLSKTSEKLQAEVLTVPHHGSKTSSSAAFIEAVSPKLGLVTAGYRSRFGHPNESVIERYKIRGVSLMNTAEHGAITLSFPNSNEAFQSKSYRISNRGFWSR